jgi:glutamate synthase domain-containing protein 2
VQEFCDAVKKRDLKDAPDFVILDGGEGGSGAAPEVLMDNVGMSIRESLPMVKETLIENGLHERVRIGASGKLILPEDVAWAMAMGADFVNSARGFLLSMGCVMAMRCNKDTCPTGLTTNNPALQKGFNPEDKGVRVANYARGVVADVEKIAHGCGLSDPRELRPDRAGRRLAEPGDVLDGQAFQGEQRHVRLGRGEPPVLKAELDEFGQRPGRHHHHPVGGLNHVCCRQGWRTRHR